MNSKKDSSIIKYVAFLRGINVGGHNKIKMVDLKNCFSTLGFKNIKTLLASGNIIFETTETNSDLLIKEIESKLEDTFGYHITVITRTISEIKELIELNPFKGIRIEKNIRLYITFLADRNTSNIKMPYESAKKDFQIILKTNQELFSVVYLSPTSNSTDLMTFIDKEFGRVNTTRNWNTVLKLIL